MQYSTNINPIFQWQWGSQIGARKWYGKGQLLAEGVRWGEETAANKNMMWIEDV